jgi:hypothetical protein
VKTEITAPELFSLIDREFLNQRPPECMRCQTPLPVRKAATPSGNWRIPAPAKCPHKCHVLLSGIVHRLQGSYELAETRR